jgi:two-component SAPR family response regulator
MASRPNALRLALHVMDQWATRVIEGSPSAYDLAISSSLTDALDFLPGWYDDWALMERERIRQRLLHALEAVSRRLARAGDYAGAVEAAMLAISAEPLRESAQRALIEAHVAEGNLAERAVAMCCTGICSAVSSASIRQATC